METTETNKKSKEVKTTVMAHCCVTVVSQLDTREEVMRTGVRVRGHAFPSWCRRQAGGRLMGWGEARLWSPSAQGRDIVLFFPTQNPSAINAHKILPCDSNLEGDDKDQHSGCQVLGPGVDPEHESIQLYSFPHPVNISKVMSQLQMDRLRGTNSNGQS